MPDKQINTVIGIDKATAFRTSIKSRFYKHLYFAPSCLYSTYRSDI